MTLQKISDYCLAKPGAYLDYPFGPDFPVIKVKAPSQEKGRIFAQPFVLKGLPKVTLNCDQATGEFYRDLYYGSVVRGWHCPPVQQPYFNTIELDGSVPDEEIIVMIEHSYSVVTAKLPKYAQRELTQL
ncbi:MAG: MmcQ/YjbR family DNA-binding protein [Oscillospiraceae bacterium]|nr:MmcQ/YjbR family DNA-binding protein [Oscillospiraceae bacterium]